MQIFGHFVAFKEYAKRTESNNVPVTSVHFRNDTFYASNAILHFV